MSRHERVQLLTYSLFAPLVDHLFCYIAPSGKIRLNLNDLIEQSNGNGVIYNVRLADDRRDPPNVRRGCSSITDLASVRCSGPPITTTTSHRWWESEAAVASKLVSCEIICMPREHDDCDTIKPGPRSIVAAPLLYPFHVSSRGSSSESLGHHNWIRMITGPREIAEDWPNLRKARALVQILIQIGQLV